MKDLKVTITPALVTANFDDLKSYLSVEVAKYDIEVKEDTVKDAKKLATELNAVTKGINAVKKEQLAILEAPAKKFKEQIAELNGIIQDGREKILVQVRGYEERTLQEINDLIVAKEMEEYQTQELSEEYHGINFSDLVLLGSITKTGNLTKKVIDEIVARVAKAKAVERAVEMRLLQLENECYKAGLKVPLSHEYIKEFLKAEDEVYHARLTHLISLELQRQEKAEAKAKFNADLEAERLLKQAEEQKKRAIKAEEALEVAEKKAETVVEAKKDPTPIAEAPEGKKTLRIAIAFDIIVREGATDDKVLSKMRDLLNNAGIPSLNYIMVENG